MVVHLKTIAIIPTVAHIPSCAANEYKGLGFICSAQVLSRNSGSFYSNAEQYIEITLISFLIFTV